MPHQKDCKPEPGFLQPAIDLNACEGKGPCIPACPYGVLELKLLTGDEFRQLSFFGRIKTRVHGREKAAVSFPEKCHACGTCVTACPEKAITLTRFLP